MDEFRRLGCAALTIGTLTLFGACSGDEFEEASGGAAGSAIDGGSGSGGGAGASGSGGSSGGTGATGGSSGNAGSAGSGGTPCQDGSCGPSEYCHSDGSCRSCGDLDELEFGPAEPVSIVNAAHTVDMRAAREVTGTPDLMYVVGGVFQPATWSIWVTTDQNKNVGSPVPAPVDGVNPEGGNLGETNPFVTQALDEGPLAKLSLFFDRIGPDLRRHVFGSWYDSQLDNFVDPVELPPPFNPEDPNRSSLEFVHAPLAERAWFVSNRDGLGGTFKIYTAATGANAAPTTVSVNLTTLPHNCPVQDQLEYGLWVSPDGKLLLFHGRETADNCTTGLQTDLYLTVMNPQTGQAAGVSAFPLPVNQPKTTDSFPSLSRDMCWLYFSSDRELSSHLRLWRARRI